MKIGQFQGGYGIVSQRKQGCATRDSGVAQREKRHYYPYPIVGENT